MLTDVTAFAPATVANVGIGFDILGHTVEAVGDRVRLWRIKEPVVRIRAISGIAGELSIDPKNNTAGRAVQAMHAALALDYGFEMEIEKGIPLASGMGGRPPPPSPPWSPPMRCSGRPCRACSC